MKAGSLADTGSCIPRWRWQAISRSMLGASSRLLEYQVFGSQAKATRPTGVRVEFLGTWVSDRERALFFELGQSLALLCSMRMRLGFGPSFGLGMVALILHLHTGCKAPESGICESGTSSQAKVPVQQVHAPARQKSWCPPCETVIGRHSSRLVPRMSGDKWGYVDGIGNWVIPGTWTRASFFSPYHTAVVMDADGAYLIDDQGNKLAEPFFYDNAPDPVQFGFSRIRDRASRKVGYISETGRFKIPPQWDYVTPFQSTQACVCNDCLTKNGEYREVGRGHWKVIDRRGKILRDLGPSSPRPSSCPMTVRDWSFFEFPYVKD